MQGVVYYQVCNCGPCPIHDIAPFSAKQDTYTTGFDGTGVLTISPAPEALRETLKPLTWRQRLWRKCFG